MNELEQALEFNTKLDALQNKNVTLDETGDYTDLLKLANTLSKTDFSAGTSIRQSLFERLNAHNRQPFQKPPIYRQYPLAASLIASLLVISILFTLPPVRTFAQEIIKRLQTITLTNAPSLFEPYLTATPTTDPNHPPVESLNLTLDEAITKAGFTPLLPTYLPDGYNLTHRDARVGQITTEFEPAGVDTSKCCIIFSIMQLWSPEKEKHSTYKYPVGNVPIADVLVRNVHGLWVQNAEIGMTHDENGKFHIMPANLLTWEEDNFLFWMTSFDVRTNIPLSQEEMMKVANTLQMPTH